MNKNNTNKLKEILEKAKKIKHIEIVVAVIIIAIVFLIVSQNFSNVEVATTSGTEEQKAESLTADSELSRILSQIENVGEVSVMITYKTTPEKITAETVTSVTNNTTSSNGTSTNSENVTKSPIIISNNGSNLPYILKEIAPQVQGVVVVAEGGDFPSVRLAIMRAVQTLLQVDASCIEIFSRK